MSLYRYNNRIVFFVHIPKSGGTSVERMLKKHGCSEALYVGTKKSPMSIPLQHMHAAVYRNLVPSDFYDYGFAIVRNPYGRIASEYKMRMEAKGGDSTRFDQWLNRVLDLVKRKPSAMENHLRPQHEFIVDPIETFRLEDGLATPIDVVFRHLGIVSSEPVPHIRKGRPEPLAASEQSLAEIARRYEDDFRIFGYQTDDYGNSFTLKEGPTQVVESSEARS